MVRRRLPRPSELRPLLRRAPIAADSDERRLRHAANIADLRAIARRRVPRAVFDYTDGAADGELSLRRARAAFARVEFRPTVLRDVSHVDTTRELLGRRAALPFAFAPTGFTRLMHHEGERAVAAVAQEVGIPYTLSTMGTTTIEEVAAAAPEARKWFQLYLWRDRAPAKELLRRAADVGYDTLMLTVDTPVSGARLRDVRNGFTVPPTLSLRTIADMAMYPRWWFDLLTTEPLEFANLRSSEGTVADLVNRVFDPALTMSDVDWLRSAWPGKLAIKGIQSVEDAVRVVDAGADAVVLSNHGGRQLDRAPVPLELVEPTAAALGDRAEVLVDTGIVHGADVLATVALGARGALIGRAYLYGLMAGGRRGVAKAVAILAGEIARTLQLIGVRSVDELRPSHVRILPNG
jgi:L-lactate dehydrogenase (cytochrome)